MDDGPAIIERLTRFGHELRDEGLSIGSGDIVTYCEALARLDPGDLEDLYWSGRATLVTRRDQLPVYDRTFRRFFLLEPEHSTETPVPPAATQSPEMRAVLEVPDAEPGIGEHEEGEESTLGLMASDAELWRKKAFSACTPDELAAVRRIMARVRLVPPTRRTRRRRASRGRGRIDMRRMVRETLRAHGDPARLRWTDRTQRVRPLVLMLDVSGSMSDYSRNLLQFAYSARRAAGRVEVFCFGTRLTRITPALDRRRPDDALERAAARVNDWDGGTRIGDSLDTFVRRWGRRGLSRGAIVVICSDGLDRGDPAVLAGALQRLARLSHRIVWMNPHQGDEREFRPDTLAMMVADPFVDSHVSGRDLRSLEDFASRLPELR